MDLAKGCDIRKGEPMTKKKQGTHFHYIVVAAEEKTEMGFKGSTRIDLIASDVDEALAIAQQLIPGRKVYWINDVVEHHNEK